MIVSKESLTHAAKVNLNGLIRLAKSLDIKTEGVHINQLVNLIFWKIK
jgi:hypothetical protein